MHRRLSGLVILAGAVAIAWAVVTLALRRGEGWVVSLLGPASAVGDAARVETVFTLLIFAPLLAIGSVAGRLDRRNALALGARPLPELGLGLVLGAAGLAATVLYARLAGVLGDGAGPGATPGLLLWGGGVIALQVLAEEVYFRGWLQPALVRRWGQPAGVVAAAIAFAWLHVAGGARGPVCLLNLFLGGLMFGLLAARGGGIAASIGAHFGWNATEQLVWGLDPNPGLGGFGAMVDQELTGAALWGGSADGLNGSVGMTVALLAILVPLMLLGWRRSPLAGRRTAVT